MDYKIMLIRTIILVLKYISMYFKGKFVQARSHRNGSYIPRVHFFVVQCKWTLSENSLFLVGYFV